MDDNQEEGNGAPDVQNIDLNQLQVENLFLGAQVNQQITHETQEHHTQETHEHHHVHNVQAEHLLLTSGDVHIHLPQGNVQADDNITEADSTSGDISLETIKEDLKRPQQEVVSLGLNYEQENFPCVHPVLRTEENFYRGGAGKTEKYKPSTQQRYVDYGSKKISFERLHDSVVSRRYTALVGAPGSGKSTIARRLSNTSSIIWILLLCMNMHYGSEKVTLRQVVVDHAYPWLSERKRNAIFAAMIESPEKFGIILDGYDQATWTLDNVNLINASYDTPILVEEIVANLCTGKFLPRISIVLTSRPHSIVTLHELLRPKEIVLVHEFTPNNMKKLFFAFAKNEAQRIWESFTKLAPVLLELCLTPILLQLILLAALGTDNLTELCNITQIFTVLLENLRRSEHAKGHDINLIKVKLTQIAYNATKNSTVIMTYPQMVEQGLRDVIVQDIIIAVPGYSHFNQKLFDGDKKFYFSHQLLQEFYTAVHISQNMGLDEFRQLVDDLVADPHWAMVRRFQCGLLLGGDFTVPESIFKKITNFPARLFNILREKVHRQPKQLKVQGQTAMFQPETSEPSTSSSTHLATPQPLDGAPSTPQASVCEEKIQRSSLLLDQHPSVAPREAQSTSSYGQLRPGSFQPQQAQSQLAQDSSVVQATDVQPTAVQPSHQQTDQQVAKQQAATPPVNQPNQLYVDQSRTDNPQKSTNEGQTEMFYKRLLKQFKRKPRDIRKIVDLQECNEAVIQSFAKHFPVEANFYRQPIGTSAAFALGRMLQHVDKPIEELDLVECDLTSQGWGHICEGIGKMTHKLKKLYLSRNQIQNAGVKSLSEIVHKLEELWLNSCGITDISPLTDAKNKDCKLKKLHLGKNQIENAGVKSLSEIVHKLEELVLEECGITDISPLTDAINNKDCKLKKLNLNLNQIQNAGVKSLSEIVHKLEELVLWLNSCGITDISPLTDAIKNKDCKIKKLVLKYNRIDDEGALELSRVLPNIEKLKVEGCSITEEGEEVIRSKLRELGLDEKRVRFF